MADLSFGLEFALTALCGLGVGYWIDRKFGTTPLFLLLGFFAGAVLGMVQLARRMK